MTGTNDTHPWRYLRGMSDWTLHWSRLDGRRGECDWAARTITLDPRLLQPERRCALTHELVHAHRQVAHHDPVLQAREESLVEQLVARALIPLDRLLDALRWAHNLRELADELWVDEATATTRLQHLHPAERHYLTRRLTDAEPQ